MMKAAEATDSLRAPTGKLADHNLHCTTSDKKAEKAGESFKASCAAADASAKQLPNAVQLGADVVNKAPSAAGTVRHPDHPDARRTHVLSNLMQTGALKSKLVPIANAASMERRKMCSCSELSYHPAAINGCSFHTSYGSCNCNVENCTWEDGLPALPLKPQPWRSSSDQSNTNAALHRALAAMKKVSGEPDAVKKAPPKPIHSRGASDLRTCSDLDMNARLITNSDARTLSMRERGRWGNSKMQQQFFAQPAVCAGAGPGQSVGKVNPMQSSERQPQQQLRHHHQQALQHVQCLHCGSFSTTPVPGAAKGARSHSFGRKVRDYSWQQELLQEQKRPEQQVKEAMGERQVVPPHSCPQGAQIDAASHHRCDYARCADMFPEYEQGAGAAVKLQHIQGGNVMSWQERYMLLCQAIAAGAFVDGGVDDMSGPILPTSRGYSWAVCECAACEVGCAAAAGGFRQGPPGYCNTSSSERMMELEAFSGPLGYVSESKAGAELSSIMEKPTGTRRRWWARLGSFGKAKGGVSIQTAAAATKIERAPFGHYTAQCSSCGQRVWTRGEEVEELGGRLCPDCIGRAGSNKSESGPTSRPTPPRAARPRPTPPFTSQHKQLPRRWRLMKLCRYLMGFPLQR